MMDTVIEVAAVLLASVVSWPMWVLTIEALAALLPVRLGRHGERVPCAILVPAHNEEEGLAATLNNLHTHLRPGDRVLVIADNCTDGTAAVARSLGVGVTERQDADRRGKGYALAHGLTHLQGEPPAVVVIVDADCELQPGALDALIEQVTATQRPAQGIYLIGTGKEADPRQRLSAFAVLFKNQVRPVGLHRLGFPCLLTGTGMAFPWSALQRVEVGTGNIVEDMKLGVDLALVGSAPQLCPSARLTGAAAPDRRAMAQQRTRWEHGHVHTLLTQTPRLLWGGMRTGRFRLWGLAAEISVAPLALVVLVWAITIALCIFLWQANFTSSASVAILLTALVGFATGLLCSWLKYARSIISLWVIAMIPLYIAWKIPIYVKLLFSRQKRWNRTQRP